MIEFGDYPEPVDYLLARERVLRSWGERERVVRERREGREESRSARDVELGILSSDGDGDVR